MQSELAGRIAMELLSEAPVFFANSLYTPIQSTEFPSGGVAHSHQIRRTTTGYGAWWCVDWRALIISTNLPRDTQWQSLRSVRYRVVLPARLAHEMQSGGWRVLAALPWISGKVDSHVHQILRNLFELHGMEPNIVLRSEDTAGLESYVRAGTACALLREEVAIPGVERNDRTVWGHTKVEAQLYFCTATERAGDPLVVALTSAVLLAWA